MRVPPIHKRYLPFRANVKRFNPIPEDWQTIYTGVPCRIGAITGTPGWREIEISSVKYSIVVVMNYEFEDAPLNIRQEDRIVIDSAVFRVDSVVDAEGMHHHWEIRVEHVETVEA